MKMLSLFCIIKICLCFGISKLIEINQDVNLQDKISDRQPLKNLRSTSKIACAAECIQENTCGTFFFNQNSYVCVMFASRMAAVNSVTSEAGWRFYHKNQSKFRQPDDSVYLCPISSGYTYDVNIDRCIKVYESGKIYTSASQTCQTEGAYLVKIDSYQMWLFVKNTVGSTRSRPTYYIQGTKDGIGVWRYDDNTEILYTNWGTNEPDNGLSDFHLIIWVSDDSKIHDVTGQYGYGYVCEIDLQ